MRMGNNINVKKRITLFNKLLSSCHISSFKIFKLCTRKEVFLPTQHKVGTYKALLNTVGDLSVTPRLSYLFFLSFHIPAVTHKMILYISRVGDFSLYVFDDIFNKMGTTISIFSYADIE